MLTAQASPKELVAQAVSAGAAAQSFQPLTLAAPLLHPLIQQRGAPTKQAQNLYLKQSYFRFPYDSATRQKTYTL